ncbi:MAG: hypothetical protein ACP5GN_07330 [Fervidicoccaceae archaeon]
MAEKLEPSEWWALRRVATALNLLIENKAYNTIDVIADSQKPELRVESLWRALRMIASEDPNRLPPQRDVEITIRLLMDEKKGKIAGSILATLSITHEKESEENKAEGGVA